MRYRLRKKDVKDAEKISIRRGRGVRSDVRFSRPDVPDGGQYMKIGSVFVEDTHFESEYDIEARSYKRAKKCLGTPWCGCPVCEPVEPEEDDEDASE